MMRYPRPRRRRARGNRAVVQPRRGPWRKRMYRPYESAVHRPCTPHSVPPTLQAIVLGCVPAHQPADDAAGREHVEDERDVEQPGPGRHAREVDPPTAGPGWSAARVRECAVSGPWRNRHQHLPTTASASTVGWGRSRGTGRTNSPDLQRLVEPVMSCLLSESTVRFKRSAKHWPRSCWRPYEAGGRGR